MTQVARQVLADCREAHAELVDGVQGSEWRRKWTTVVTLLRTSLHVLKKVDARDGGRSLQDTIDRSWERLSETRPEPAILWEFIDKDRDLILKEYWHRAGQSVTVMVGGGRPHRHSYHMNEGYFTGKDPRDVALEAIHWVETYLDEIDEAVRESSGSQHGAGGDP